MTRDKRKWFGATEGVYRIGMVLWVLEDDLAATRPYRVHVLAVNRINQPYVQRLDEGSSVPFYLFKQWVRPEEEGA